MVKRTSEAAARAARALIDIEEQYLREIDDLLQTRDRRSLNISKFSFIFYSLLGIAFRIGLSFSILLLVNVLTLYRDLGEEADEDDDDDDGARG